MYVGTRFLQEPTAARREIQVRCVDATDGITPETGEAGAQPQLVKPGGSANDTSATLTAVDAAKGIYKVVLTASELDTPGLNQVIYKGTATAVATAEFEVTPSPIAATGTVQASAAAAATTITLPTGLNLDEGAILTFVAGTGVGTGAIVDTYTTGTGSTTLKAGLTAAIDTDTVFAAYIGPPTDTGDLVTAMWEELIASHSGVSGSMAEQLAAAGAAGDPWATAIPGTYSSGQAGKVVGDALDAAVSSVNTAIAALNNFDPSSDTVALSSASQAAVVAAVFARAFSAAYSSLTFDEIIKVMVVVLAGKVSGLSGTSPAFRTLADTADAVTATVDADGNRTAVTLNP